MQGHRTSRRHQKESQLEATRHHQQTNHTTMNWQHSTRSCELASMGPTTRNYGGTIILMASGG